MNTLKKTALVISLLIPANGLFAFDIYKFGSQVKNSANNTWTYISSNTKKGWDKFAPANALNQAKDTIKNHPIITTSAVVATSTAAFLATKYKDQIKKFAKDQKANAYNKYADLKEKYAELKNKYDNLDNAKKSNLKKITLATSAPIATGLAAFIGYKAYKALKK